MVRVRLKSARRSQEATTLWTGGRGEGGFHRYFGDGRNRPSQAIKCWGEEEGKVEGDNSS